MRHTSNRRESHSRSDLRSRSTRKRVDVEENKIGISKKDKHYLNELLRNLRPKLKDMFSDRNKIIKDSEVSEVYECLGNLQVAKVLTRDSLISKAFGDMIGLVRFFLKREIQRKFELQVDDLRMEDLDIDLDTPADQKK